MYIFDIKNNNTFFTDYFRSCSDKFSKVYYFVTSFFDSIKRPFCESPKGPKVVIIGSGPAAYTAAIYTGRANLETIVYEGTYDSQIIPGGQLMTTTVIENFPGFPNGIEGSELVANMREQAIRFGAKMIGETVVSVDLNQHPFIIQGQKTQHTALAVIVATGSMANRPDIPGTRLGELWQKGVSACAVCDGALPQFRNKNVFVIGGGDSAMEEALFLSKFAKKVFIVHRRDQLRASQIMQKAVLANPKIEVIWNSIIVNVKGKKAVEQVVIKNVKTKEETTQEASGVFFATGHSPNTQFLNGQLNLDSEGYIVTNPGTSETSLPNVFAAGDVKDHVYRQAITASGSGCIAALEVEKALNHH